MTWRVYSELVNGESHIYETRPPASEDIRRIPGIEFSGDGCWATVYRGGKPVAVYVWAGDELVKRRKPGTPIGA